MRIRLGGKGYAPAAQCPLLKHSKGLGEFNDLIQKLQTIVEEDTSVEYVRILSEPTANFNSWLVAAYCQAMRYRFTRRFSVRR